MKTVSQTYKDNIKQLGKEIDSIISYTIDGVSYELGNDLLNSVMPHYEGNILKSVMKQLDLESLVDIPIGTIINYQFGLKVSENDYDDTIENAYRINYEYINLGNYIVYSSEKQEDNNAYKIICYDKILNAMKQYDSFTTYPITIRNYINSLCNHIGIQFANSSDTFANYDKEIPRELYLDENGYSLNYTFRDVLDELAQVTASTICINDEDKLEIRYITDTIGKNKFNSNTSDILNAYIDNNTKKIVSNVGNRIAFIKCKPNTTYCVSKLVANQFQLGTTEETPIIGSTCIDFETSRVTYGDRQYMTITTSSNANYLLVRYVNIAQQDEATIRESMQIEEGSVPTEFEQFGLDKIDEENLKDVNVNFGEYYGPINTISIKRSESSDVITKSIPENLSDDLKVEIAIEDNQILNDDNRADYIDDILNQLYGLQFYKNDFTSTGITYLELCDKYNVSITKYDDNEDPYTNMYSCIILNDEILVTQGLEENIHTDLPEQSETDYETASKDDRTRTRAALKVDKAVGEITASVSKIEDIEETIYGDYELTKDTTYQEDTTYYIFDGTDYIEFTDFEVGDTIPANTIYERDEQSSLEQRMQQAEQTLTEQGLTLEIKTSKIDDEGNTTSFKTTNYTLDENGFEIDDGSGYKSLSTTTGQYYYDNNVMVGKYTKDIAVHKDLALYGKYYYGIDESVDVENFSKDDAMFMAQMYEAQWEDEYGTTQTEIGLGHFYNMD